MIFQNREEAGQLLLNQLLPYKGQNPLVLAVPRGAIKMASIIKEGLEGELGVILVHKIGSPNNEEFAIGSVGLSGVITRQPYLNRLGIEESYVTAEGERQLEILKKRFKNYGLNEEYYRDLYQDRIVIIVDDGMATGATILSAIAEVKVQKPAKIIVAAAVASLEAAKIIKKIADELVVLHIPDDFYSVSQFYRSFSQVSDEEVIEILKAT
jgi:putative phosphoribosyl transferase